MAIEKVTAWKITTGQCFESKAEACHEEMIHLIRSRGETNAMKIASRDSLDQAVIMQQELVDGVKELKDCLNEKADAESLATVNDLLTRAEGWMADAVQLQSNMQESDT